jgi:3-(3-hydroxy-phenyl)propionate hydroxylase
MDDVIADLIVVGAGPVGLSLALATAGAGAHVLVLEQNRGTSAHSRAPAIWPRTQEILDDLGVIAEFERTGIVVEDIAIRHTPDGRVLLHLPLHELRHDTRFPRLLVVPQSTTERLLCERLVRQPTAGVRFETRVTELTQDAREVRVTCDVRGRPETHRARFLAGCDGAHSTVRDLLRLSFPGVTYSLRAALADVRLHERDDGPFPRVTTAGVLAVGIRIERDLWRLVLPFGRDAEVQLDARIARSVRALFGQEAYDVVWQSEFHLHRRLAEAFTRGRVALAGDAAHLNSPVGGQGMNAGIQDAAALARAFRRALADDATAPLADYARERRRAVEGGVNAFTDTLTKVLLLGEGRFVPWVLRAADLAFHVHPLRRAFLRRLAMLDAPRRSGPPTTGPSSSGNASSHVAT